MPRWLSRFAMAQAIPNVGVTPAPACGRALRVLHVIPTLMGGGAENFLCSLVSSFDTDRVRAAIMAVYPTPIPRSVVDAAIPVIELGRRGRYDPLFLTRMIRCMRDFAPDIVHSHLHNGKYWGRLAAMAARVPIILFTEHSPCGEKRVFAERIVDAVVNRLTDGVITFTEHQRALLSRREGVPIDKIAVIENGIPLLPFPTAEKRKRARNLLGVNEDEFVILVLGRLVAIKNKQLAVRASQYVNANSRARMRMFLIGGGEEEQALREAACRLHVADRVMFLGHRDDAAELLYGGDILYMPSLVEGMPLAVLEAMNIGLPVVSSPWAGAADLLRDGEFGFVVKDWEPQSAASVFENLMADPTLLQQVSNKAIVFARERYDIRRVARLHEALYERLGERRGLLQKTRSKIMTSRC